MTHPRPAARPSTLPLCVLAVLALLVVVVAHSRPAHADGLDIGISFPAGTEIAIPDWGPERILVPFVVEAGLGADARVAGMRVYARVREVRPDEDRPDSFETVEGSVFRIDNLSPIRMDLAAGRSATARFHIAAPRSIRPGEYHFQVDLHGGRGGVRVFSIMFVRGLPDFDLAPVELRGLPETLDDIEDGPLQFRVQVANRGRLTWDQARAIVRVTVIGEGAEHVVREFRLGIVPGGAQVSLSVEADVENPRQVTVMVDPLEPDRPEGRFPESDEDNNLLEEAVGMGGR